MIKFFTACSLALLISLPAHADIVWAVAGPDTGPVAAIGIAQKAGIKQAVEDINAAGGINGEKIIVKTYDDGCDPKQAVAIANKIISQNIHFAIHGTCSSSALAAEKAYIDEGTVVINTVSSNPKITDQGGPTIFRSMYRDDNAALVLSDEIIKNFAHKKLVILNDKSTYGLDVATDVGQRVNKAGIKEILFEAYDPTSRDYSVLVTKMKEMGAEIIFIGGMPADIALITRQLHASGSTAQVIGGDLALPEFWKITGPLGEGTLFAFPPDPRKSPGVQDVITKLQKSAVIVDGYTLYAYAATQVLAQAIAKAGAQDPAKVAATIHADTFDTILGKWSFDDKGDVRNLKQVLYHWHDGDFEELPK